MNNRVFSIIKMTHRQVIVIGFKGINAFNFSYCINYSRDTTFHIYIINHNKIFIIKK